MMIILLVEHFCRKKTSKIQVIMQSDNIYSYTVVGNNINIMKTTFLFNFLVLTSFFRFTSLQVIEEKLFQITASLCYHLIVYPCSLKS